MKQKHSAESNQARRHLLKKLTMTGTAVYAVGSLPTTWMRPLVQTTLLPAHAATSGAVFFSNELISLTSRAPVKWYARWLNKFVKEAEAAPSPYTACGVVMGDQILITWQNNRNSRRFEGLLDIDGSNGVLKEIANNSGGGCGPKDGSNAASIKSINDDFVRLFIDATNTEYYFDIPRGNKCSFPSLNGSCGI